MTMRVETTNEESLILTNLKLRIRKQNFNHISFNKLLLEKFES